MTTFTNVSTFYVETCCSCSIQFGMPEDFHRRKLSARGEKFYCPNGHAQWYTGESDKDRAQRLSGQLDQERTRLAQERQVRRDTEQQLAYAHRTRKAVSTRLKKLKNRVGHGVCPCCSRTFEQLAKHMATKHPSYAASAEHQ